MLEETGGEAAPFVAALKMSIMRVFWACIWSATFKALHVVVYQYSHIAAATTADVVVPRALSRPRHAVVPLPYTPKTCAVA
jgi:hypothetical protein